MRKDRLKKRVSKNAAIMMAAMLDCLAEQIFREASKVATDNKKKRIWIEHIDHVIQGNAALQKAYSEAIINAGEMLEDEDENQKEDVDDILE